MDTLHWKIIWKPGHAGNHTPSQDWPGGKGIAGQGAMAT